MKPSFIFTLLETVRSFIHLNSPFPKFSKVLDFQLFSNFILVEVVVGSVFQILCNTLLYGIQPVAR